MIKADYVKYAMFLIIGLVIGILVMNIPVIQNKQLRQLHAQNDSLYGAINKRDANIKELNENAKEFEKRNLILLQEILAGDAVISKLESKIDSVNSLIDLSDGNILKIKKEENEEVNSVPSWDDTRRVLFFSNYFKTENN